MKRVITMFFLLTISVFAYQSKTWTYYENMGETPMVESSSGKLEKDIKFGLSGARELYIAFDNDRLEEKSYSLIVNLYTKNGQFIRETIFEGKPVKSGPALFFGIDDTLKDKLNSGKFIEIKVYEEGKEIFKGQAPLLGFDKVSDMVY